jgi:hypothetical protein
LNWNGDLEKSKQKKKRSENIFLGNVEQNQETPRRRNMSKRTNKRQKRQRETDRAREKERDRDRETETERKRKRKREREREREKERERERRKKQATGTEGKKCHVRQRELQIDYHQRPSVRSECQWPAMEQTKQQKKQPIQNHNFIIKQQR